MAEILHFVQNDRRRVQNDKDGISLIATQSSRGEGRPFIPPAELGGILEYFDKKRGPS